MDDDGPDEPATDPLLSATPALVLTASPLPPAPQDVEADVRGDEVTMQLGHRRYRVRGLSKNLAFDQMKVNVLATTEKGMFVDTFDLYAARHRRQFIAQAAVELDVEEQIIKKDLGRVLLKLEELQDRQISQTMAPKEPVPTMTPEEKGGGLTAVACPEPVGPDRGGLRCGGRDDQQAGRATWPPSAASSTSRWPSSSSRRQPPGRPRSWKPSLPSCRRRIRSSIPP